MKTAVVIAHYNRHDLLKRTLESFDHQNVDIIIVDDGSDIPYPGAIHLPKSEKYWSNDGTIPYNRGIERALDDGAELLILQNAECYHMGDVIGYAQENIREGNYISFPCFSLGKDSVLEESMVLNDRIVQFNGDDGWYNHRYHRPVGFMFCAAITAANIRKLNGFDERFSYGVACADEDFMHRLKLLGLSVEIPDRPVVVHQWHYEGFDPYSRDDLYKKNQILAAELKETGNYKANHLITKNFI